MPTPFLKSGTSFGPYVVGDRVGAGGMGEVYRARDTRLGRDVAIKVLPEAFAFDDERRSRFQREARALASLNHPHIGAIHGLEESSGHLALVLELVEGPTLADRLHRGPIPHAEAVAIAGQIAAALDAAHQTGIIHRDLKPANIKLAPGRGVKVLDFGLAKALSEQRHSVDADQIPTVTSDGTLAGVILGTAAYMSPEQARGLPVDKRTDIWAFGCVLYEMLTGRRTFAGRTTSDTIVSVLEREPDWQAVPAETSARLRHLIRRCLEKDPQRRLRDIGDATLELAAPAAEQEWSPAAGPVRRLPQWWVLAAAALGLIALTAGATRLALGRREGTASPSAGAVRFSIPPPPGNRFGGSLSDVETTYIALSPDGSQLAFVATDQKGTSRVWLRRMASLDAQPLIGTEGTNSLFWSYDGRSIGFFAGDQLKRLDLPDGRPVSLTKIPTGVGLAGTWTPDGRILFGNIQGREISEIPTAGGTPRAAATADPGRELRSYWPSIAADGRLMYLVGLKDGSGELKLAEPGGAPRTLMSVNSNAAWVDPGYIVFAREGTLLAQQFDVAQGRFVGDPHAIADAINYSYLPPRAMFTASRTGAIVYQSHRESARLVRFDRTGRELGALGRQTAYWSLRISPAGNQMVTAALDPRFGTTQLWLFDFDRGGVETPLRNDPRPALPGPWGPGRTIVFSASLGASPQLVQRDLATGSERELSAESGFTSAGDFTPDGKQLVFNQRGARGIWALMTMTLEPQPTVAPLLPSSFSQQDPRLSRDGKALAFLSNASGQRELYLSPFPPTGPPIPTSSGGARIARWNPDGRELFYLSGDKLMVVEVSTAPSLRIGRPRALFPVAREWRDFNVTLDGKFIAVVPQVLSREQPLTAVLNWQSEIRR